MVEELVVLTDHTVINKFFKVNSTINLLGYSIDEWLKFSIKYGDQFADKLSFENLLNSLNEADITKRTSENTNLTMNLISQLDGSINEITTPIKTITPKFNKLLQLTIGKNKDTLFLNGDLFSNDCSTDDTTESNTIEPKRTIKTHTNPGSIINFIPNDKILSNSVDISNLKNKSNNRPNNQIHNSINFKKTREIIGKELYDNFNKTVFDDKLPNDMSIIWNKRLRKTAGMCANSINNGIRISVIHLSSKICIDLERLRDTLIHELCHAATWIIDQCKNGHGHLWKLWASRAMKKHPYLNKITVCHQFELTTKYSYKCSEKSCTYSIGRDSKSIDLENSRCPFCSGELELYSTDNLNTPLKSKPLTPFASFIKENYSIIKMRNTSHASTMGELSKLFSNMKLNSNKKLEPQNPIPCLVLDDSESTNPET